MSKEKGVYSFLKLLLEADILCFKDSYLLIPTFEKMAFKVLVPFFFCPFFFTFPIQNDFCIPITYKMKWNMIVQ